jgi:hypothetical protein
MSQTKTLTYSLQKAIVFAYRQNAVSLIQRHLLDLAKWAVGGGRLLSWAVAPTGPATQPAQPATGRATTQPSSQADWLRLDD